MHFNAWRTLKEKGHRIMNRWILAVLLTLGASPLLAENSITNTATSWSMVKEWARDDVYHDHRNTFYCDCAYTPRSSSGGDINLSSCSYDGANESHAHRADRLEWEHVVPASLMPARLPATSRSRTLGKIGICRTHENLHLSPRNRPSGR